MQTLTPDIDDHADAESGDLSRIEKRGRNTFQYRGTLVYPAPLNSSGIRWHTIAPALRSDTKAGIKQLIREGGAK
jgi:hypothetical protein